MTNTSTTAVPKKSSRKFLPEELKIESWNSLEPFYKNLLAREIFSQDELLQWLHDMSEMESTISEHLGWLYINMTCNTQDKQASEAYTFFVNEIQPKIAPCEDELNKKFLASEFSKKLNDAYQLQLRSVDSAVKIFRTENISLFAEMAVKEQGYGEIAGDMSVEINGKTLTLQQASNFLKEQDRNLRENVFHKITNRRLQDKEKLDELFNELIQIRNKIAVNAGFNNYRDYKFVELDRFDYSANDCEIFHQSVQQSVVPVLNEILDKRKEDMKLSSLKPWDLEVDTSGKPDLKPFSKGEELVQKTIQCFNDIDPYFGEVVETLHSMKHLDLDSRIGKAPGGYNYPLYETGVPFIFMNSSGQLRDVITMVHEGGHAIHSMLTRDLEFVGFKELPSEIAELASMSMELISMEHWDFFFENEDDLRRAKLEQLENVVEALPWIACIDKFQHWIYTHPQHSVDERIIAWTKIYSDFSSNITDWSGEEKVRNALWQKQLHLFEVPFYYIEYGIAQLGAIAIWRNYKQDSKLAIKNYVNALKLGFTKTIPEIYEVAGVRFDFSEDYIKELIDFVRGEIKKL